MGEMGTAEVLRLRATSAVSRDKSVSAPLRMTILLAAAVSPASVRGNLFCSQCCGRSPLKCEQRQQISRSRGKENQQRIVGPKHPHQKREYHAANGANGSSDTNPRSHRTGWNNLRRPGKNS